MNEKKAKDYITEGLLKLMEKNHYEDITITDITKKAGVNRVTFYRNFISKDEVIKLYLDDITDKFIEQSNIIYDPNNFDKYLITLFNHLMATKEIGTILYKANMIHYIKEEFDRIFSSKASNQKEQYNYYFIAGGLYNIYFYWIKSGCKETPTELANMFIDFYILKGNRN